MKKIESIKTASDKFRKAEESSDKRKPLSQSSRPNLLNDSTNEPNRRQHDLSHKLLSVDRDNSSECPSLF